MKQQHKTPAEQEIPDRVLRKAVARLKAGGFKWSVETQARHMIEDTAEVVSALGGRIVWGR